MLTPDTILQNRYRIIRQLGQGGMGTVYEAVDERLNIRVAIKETHFTDEKLKKQFEREAQLLASLHHAAMPKVIDHFSEDRGQFLVMSFIPGEDLWEILSKRNTLFPVAEVLAWADQLLDALDYLHTQELPIIHRDIKPQNLKLTSRGQIILLDFGLAKTFTGQLSRATSSGSIFGYTPSYAPLEQIHGTGTDARTDLYSLAATLYHLLTGVAPPDALSRATAIMNEQPDPLLSANEINDRVPNQVANVLERAMANNRSKRLTSASQMREMLRDAGSKNVEPAPTVLSLPIPNIVPERKTRTSSVQTWTPTLLSQPDLSEPSVTGRHPSTSRMLWITIILSINVITGAGLIYAYLYLGGLSNSSVRGSTTPTPSNQNATSSTVYPVPTANAPTNGPSPSVKPSPLVSPQSSPVKDQPLVSPSILSAPASEAVSAPTPITEPSPPPPPATPDPPKRTVPISGGILNGRAISLPKPAYPAVAKAARQTGTVTVQVTIDENGNVISARAVSGPPLLLAAAQQAAYGAKFSPTTNNGYAVKVTGVITYNFQL